MRTLNILLITAGGTIVQELDEDGHSITVPFDENQFSKTIVGIQESLNKARKIKRAGGNGDTHKIDQIDIVEAFNKDSTNVISEDWVQLIDIIEKFYKKYDAFVITHGTNTLGYTSAALSFALGNLDKPVVLTGAQVPYGQPGSDAQMNLENAIRIAAYSEKKLAGVMVVFGSMIITGTRAKKKTEFDIDAFKSFNAGALGTIGNSVRINEAALELHMGYLLNKPDGVLGALDVKKTFIMKIASLTEYPGVDPTFIQSLVNSNDYPVKGIILRATGAGDPNVAPADAEFRNLWSGFEFLLKRKIPIVVTTQAPDGIASMTINTPGALAYNLGAIPAHDMSMESMTVKLAWLLGNEVPYKKMREAMTTSIRGEISPIR
jgi:L-asparaginase